jgi:hypothetical protein
VDRIAHLGPYRDENDLEVVREGERTEIVVNGRRHELQPGDRISLHAKWDFWKTAPLVASETTVTLVRASERIDLCCFEFDAMWGGWMPEKIREELQKIGCEVSLSEEKHEH